MHGITWRENIRKSYLSTSERVSLFRNYHGGRWVKIDQLLGLIWGGMIKVVDRYNITSDRISQVGYCKMSETSAGGPWRQAATKGGGGRDDAVSRPAR